MKYLAVFMLLYIVGNAIGCGGGRSWIPARKSPKAHSKTTRQDYWTPKPGVKAEWEAWLVKWKRDSKKKLEDEKKKNATDSDYYDDGPGADAPFEWKGLGPGMDGQDPPPWAILKGEGGKPDYCFEKPSYGDCDLNQTRWGYNPFVKECQYFKYSGCGGNLNNFRDKVGCVATCEVTPRPNCAIYD